MEPSPRFAHYTAPVGKQLFVFGGRTKGFTKSTTLGSCIFSFDQCKEQWLTKQTAGTPPPGLYDGTCTASGRYIYLYGGYDGAHQKNSLHRLDTDSLEWLQLASGTTRKSGCGMVSYQGKLILFGGYEIPSDPTQKVAKLKKGTHESRYSNKLLSFNIKEGEELAFVSDTTAPYTILLF